MDMPTTPGAIIGYRKNGRPIHLIAGGSEAAAEQGTDGGQGQAPDTQQEDAQAQQLLADAAKENKEKDGGKPAPERVEDLPDWAQRVIRDARKGEGDKRAALREAESKISDTESRYQQTLDGIAKALGYKQDDSPPDPEEMAKQLSTKDEQLTKAQEAERSARRQSVAERAMHKHGADVEQMSDSKKFARELEKLDPDGETFTNDLDELVKTTLNDNPKYKAASQAPATSSGDFSSGPGEQRNSHSKGLYAAFKNAYGG
ncbi:hypothetical protein F4561_002674 [Lipingzhangella halophila]|uniref:Phage protein n=1 Tax=Lipingzhangella halophila TaxID=1783352 RepID=A0A7W7RH25_9ACTN|nr:hypothetical protein [Lipingzhangella halophila]MBB4931854.1 hypothetical protein [Lipingzhangella halophila]